MYTSDVDLQCILCVEDVVETADIFLQYLVIFVQFLHILSFFKTKSSYKIYIVKNVQNRTLTGFHVLNSL